MDMQMYAQIAEVIAALALVLTLVFLVIELRKNISQTKLVNIANRDLVNSEFVHFWADEKNAVLVVKGRNNFASLNRAELYQFESFIEQRVKLFAFGSTTVFGEDRIIQQHKIREFFQYPGAIECYQKMVANRLIPPMWRTVVDPALTHRE